MTRDELLGALGAERVRALEKDIEDEANCPICMDASRATNARRVRAATARFARLPRHLAPAQAVGDGDKGACPLCRHEVDPEDGVLSLKSLVDALEALDVNVERDAAWTRRGRRFRGRLTTCRARRGRGRRHGRRGASSSRR